MTVPALNQSDAPIQIPALTRNKMALPHAVQKFLQFAGNPIVRRALPTILVAVLICIGALYFVLAQSRHMRTLFTNLSDSDKAAVTAALESGNLTFEIDTTSGAILTSTRDYHKARMLLAAQGIPKAAPSGYDLLSDMPIGTSRALEQARLKQSQESEIARSIAEIAIVSEARVHLALPEPSVFVRDAAKPSASIFLKLVPGRVLSEQQVQSIVHLVASSVPGLASDRVSIVDQLGNLLTPGDGTDDLAESQKRLDYQRRLESQYRERLTALLTPLVGASNFTAEIHVDLDFTEQQQTREAFDRNNAVLKSERADDSSDGQTIPSGIPGALSNLAPATPQTTPASNAVAAPPTRVENRRAESYTRNYEVGKEVSVTKKPVGEVQRLAVAIVLRAGSAVKPAMIKPIEQLVRNTVGFNQARGDVVTLSVQPFAAVPEAPKARWYENSWIADQAPTLLAVGIMAFVMIFGLRKPIKSITETLSSSHNQPHQILAGPPLAPQLPTPTLSHTNSYDDKVTLMRDFVAQDTARATNVFKKILRSDGGGSAAHG